MGKIVGWTSIDSKTTYVDKDAATESQLTQIDTESFELKSEDGDSQEFVPTVSCDAPDVDAQAAFNDDGYGDEALRADVEVIEDADLCGVEIDEAVANELLDILQANFSDQIVVQEGIHGSVESSKTERICKAIGNLQPLFHRDSYGKYCDITDASDKMVRALILAADSSELDFFAILEKLQEVVRRQGEIAGQYTSTLESPNLNSLIEFVGSLALDNACD